MISNLRKWWKPSNFYIKEAMPGTFVPNRDAVLVYLTCIVKK